MQSILDIPAEKTRDSFCWLLYNGVCCIFCEYIFMSFNNVRYVFPCACAGSIHLVGAVRRIISCGYAATVFETLNFCILALEAVLPLCAVKYAIVLFDRLGTLSYPQKILRSLSTHLTMAQKAETDCNVF